jgi:GH15 family glucan-1,4-alpha-glucosidase
VSASLVDVSLAVIAANQASSGAYVAAPGYDTYAYSWLRDGAFVAASMDAFGHSASATAFHGWVARTVERHAHKVEALERELSSERDLGEEDLHVLEDRLTLHTRFTAAGEEGSEAWGDFQLDGYGFWLTSLAAHLSRTGSAVEPYAAALDLVRRYLELAWARPCYDSWEEYPGRRHMTTWAAIAQGLRATDGLLGGAPAAAPDRILARLAELGGPDHVLRKFVPGEAPVTVAAATTPAGSAVAGHERVGRPLDPAAIDGSSLLVLGPFGPFAAADETVAATLAEVAAQLVVEGGVHRYLDDEYYGGGLWVVLAGALAIVEAPQDPLRAKEVLGWIEDQADAKGYLPEQVASHLCSPAAEAPWVERWGPPARPLLWSHAMYLLAVDALRPALLTVV